MRLAVFGLTISSSFGNGHATLWRGLSCALARRGGSLVFFERDVEWYANHRDAWDFPGCELVVYKDWEEVRARAEDETRSADAAIVTSFCPDAGAAADLVFSCARRAAFYELDAPVTLARLARGERVDWIELDGLASYDVVFSFAGGPALTALKERLGARRVLPLYGHADPAAHRPGPRDERFRADLSYLGTYAADRQARVEQLFIAPARSRPERAFLIAGAMYPDGIDWPSNVRRLDHVVPPDHPAFFASARAQLNITRADMAEMGWCPSGRLFEAAATGAVVISDCWDGLGAFFRPGEEVLIAERSEDVVAALDLSDAELARIGTAARERFLNEHTSSHRLETLLDGLAAASQADAQPVFAEG